jgi:hypothetical protein
MKNFLLPENVRNELISYLMSNRPMSEVEPVVNILRKLPIFNPRPEKEEEK